MTLRDFRVVARIFGVGGFFFFWFFFFFFFFGAFEGVCFFFFFFFLLLVWGSEGVLSGVRANRFSSNLA